MNDPVRNRNGKPIGLYGSLTEWADGRLATAPALRLTGCGTFWELVRTTIDHGIPLTRTFTEAEATLADLVRMETATPPRLDAHAITERATLFHHILYAGRIDEEPGLIMKAIAMLEDGAAASALTLGEKHWLTLLTTTAWPDARAVMIADTPEGRLLRSHSPFSLLIGLRNEGTRRALWRLAKVQLMHEAAETGLSRPRETLKPPTGDVEFEESFLHNIQEDDGSAARDMLQAGRPIHIRRANTPPGHVTRVHPDGQEELVRVDANYAKDG